MSGCSPGRNDSDPVTAFRVGNVQDHALAHSKDVDALFTVVLAFIDFFDREWIAHRVGALRERDAVAVPILGRLGAIPFKRVFIHVKYGIPVPVSRGQTPENARCGNPELLSLIRQQRLAA
jgi:hypothetical protein